MNGRKLLRGFDIFPRSWFGSLALLSAAFAAGVIAGSFLSAGACSGDEAAGFIDGYIGSVRGAPVGQARMFLSLSKFHLAAFLLGFSMLGVVLIPALSMLRGFTLAFTLSLFVRVYSLEGALAGAAVLGASSLVSLPLFFLLAAQSMNASLSLTGMGVFHASPGQGIYTKAFFIRFFTAVLLLLLLSLGERAVLSRIFSRFPVVS